MKNICLRIFLPLLALFSPAARAQSTPPSRPPNIILLLTDDQGYGDIGIHGNDKIQTPNLDRFATEGVEFTRFYVSPVCAPTRASLMTGRYFYRSGVLHTYRGGARMDGDEVTLAELLKAVGYRTGIFGKWHLGDSYPMRAIDQGFDEALVLKSGGITQPPDRPNSYFDPLLWENGKAVRRTGYCTDIFFNAALDFIASNRERPFFAYIPTNAPHTPLEVAEDYAAPYRAMGLDDATARVYGMEENIDENFGRLLAKLDELDLRRNTILIVLSDNGPQQPRYTAGLRDRKTSVFEGGIRALSLWQWPAVLNKPRKIATLAAHIDVAPTLVEIAGAPAPIGRAFDGRSLLPLLRDDAQAWPERTLFFQVHRGLAPQRYRNASVETSRYKLVLTPNAFNGDHIAIPAEPASELYDLENDPGEKQNVIAKLPQIAAELRQRYEAWFDDVKSSRQFTPGAIHIGSEVEPETVLCRYQDANYDEETPLGWSVQIEKAGRYEVQVRTSDDSWEPSGMTDATRILVRCNGQLLEAQPEAGTAKAVFALPKGETILDVWIQEKGKPRVIPPSNTAVGDVKVHFVADGQ
jgi:arylsulfatase A